MNKKLIILGLIVFIFIVTKPHLLARGDDDDDGDDNIYIGNSGVASDTTTIKIGAAE
jgi:hypothetical protein